MGNKKVVGEAILDTSIPGYAELSGWPSQPYLPAQIVGIHIYRDGGTVGVTLKGTMHNQIELFFDRVLGRLCFGEHENCENAAFIKRGSTFEKEVFAYLESARGRLTTTRGKVSEGDVPSIDTSDIEVFDSYLQRAKAYTGI